MGSLAVFFGRKMTIDNLIPLQTSCFNKKDDQLNIECLRSIPYLGLRVGQLTLSRFLLIACTHLLNDSQENVVYEMVVTLNKLLQFGLLSKEDALENFQRLAIFIQHPSPWIREEVEKYIAYLSDPANKILTSAEAYCLVRPEVKKYRKLPAKEVQNNIISAQFPSSKQMFGGQDIQGAYNEAFEKIRDITKTYRIIQSTIAAQLSGVSFGQTQIFLNTKSKNENYVSEQAVLEYVDSKYNRFNKVELSEIDATNNGLNKRAFGNTAIDFETDSILQALNLFPDDPNMPLIAYKNPNYFTNLSVQSLPIGSLLSVEQSSEVPQQTPEFLASSKTAQFPINSANRDYYSLGYMKSKFNKWRPSGRLITTLFEHKNAVNALAITDDSQIFITGSKVDSHVKIWMAKDIEADVTSHSRMQVKSRKQINAITTLENSNYFAVAGSQGTVDIYQMSRVEQEATKTFVGTSYEPNEVSALKSIEKKDEGDIVQCINMILPISHEHLLTYVTQRGSLYLHDLRARYDVACDLELLGCQKGMPTCMTIGQDPYQMYFGTLGGYIMVYDVRYNVIASQYKHFTRAPINSISTFHPSKYLTNLNLNRSDSSSPLALVSSGASNYEVCLVNLETSAVEVLLTVDDRKNKESFLSGLPTVPSFFRESVFQVQDFDYGQPFKKNETNQSLFKRYLQSCTNSQHFKKLLTMQQQSLLKNLDEDWLKNSKNRYMLVKSAYESGNACRKILVPRLCSSLIENPDTATYAITGGNDKKLRFWDFTGLKKKSYCINSPNDDEQTYHEEFQGETLVIQEKVQQYKQFPQINAQLASRQFDVGVMANPNTTYYNNSTYYSVLGSMVNGANNQNNDGRIAQPIGNGVNGVPGLIDPRQNYQCEKIGDQEIIYNFNGLSEWQHFNGVSMNQGCGTIGTADNTGGLKPDYLFRESQVVSHQDCILDMGMLEIAMNDPILITCGRDGLVKLWR